MNFESLPFVKTDPEGQVVSTWDVTRSGDYAADCGLGRKYFRDLLMVISLTGNELLLCRVLTGQAAVFKDWGAVEIGFHHEMAETISLI